MTDLRKAAEMALDALEEKFTSGNSIPVERATITAEEYQALRQALAQPEQCTWNQYDSLDMPETWETSCGELWTFTEGGLKENRMRYCHSCGKPAIEAALRSKNNG